ncbi:MAG: AraC family transcriptional regulator [Sphingomonas sp.]
MSRGRAKLAISEGVSVWMLEAPGGFGEADFHAHHAIQITVALWGELELATAELALRMPAIAVAAGVRHRLRGSGLHAFIFVEPESRHGRALAALFVGGGLVALDHGLLAPHVAHLAATFDRSLGSEVLLAAGRATVAALVSPEEPRLTDARIARVIAHAAGNLDGPFSLHQAAEVACLSPSRLRHLFVEQTGLAFKTYVQWLRMVRALQAYSEGCSLTEAAHAAGFSDSAHFSRVFRRTFGTPATHLTRL